MKPMFMRHAAPAISLTLNTLPLFLSLRECVIIYSTTVAGKRIWIWVLKQAPTDAD